MKSESEIRELIEALQEVITEYKEKKVPDILIASACCSQGILKWVLDIEDKHMRNDLLHSMISKLRILKSERGKAEDGDSFSV